MKARMSTALNLSLEGIGLWKAREKRGKCPPMLSPRLPSVKGLLSLARGLFTKVTFVHTCLSCAFHTQLKRCEGAEPWRTSLKTDLEVHKEGSLSSDVCVSSHHGWRASVRGTVQAKLSSMVLMFGNSFCVSSHLTHPSLGEPNGWQ